MVSIHSLALDEQTKELLVQHGIWYTKDVFLFNTEGLMDYLKIGRKKAKKVIKKSLKAKAAAQSEKTAIYDGFLKEVNRESVTANSGRAAAFPHQGLTQVIGKEATTDVVITEWIRVQGTSLVINCRKEPFETELSFSYSLRQATSLDEQIMHINSLVKVVKNKKVKSIVIRGFLSNIKDLAKENSEAKKAVKTMGKRLQRLSKAYTLPILITSQTAGPPSLTECVNSRISGSSLSF